MSSPKCIQTNFKFTHVFKSNYSSVVEFSSINRKTWVNKEDKFGLSDIQNICLCTSITILMNARTQLSIRYFKNIIWNDADKLFWISNIKIVILSV